MPGPHFSAPFSRGQNSSLELQLRHELMNKSEQNASFMVLGSVVSNMF